MRIGKFISFKHKNKALNNLKNKYQKSLDQRN